MARSSRTVIAMRVSGLHLLLGIMAVANMVNVTSLAIMIISTVRISTRRSGDHRFLNAVLIIIPFLVVRARRNGILLSSVELAMMVGVVAGARRRALVGQSLPSSAEERMFSVRSIFDVEPIGGNHISLSVSCNVVM